jgi:hypothetical protein
MRPTPPRRRTKYELLEQKIRAYPHERFIVLDVTHDLEDGKGNVLLSAREASILIRKGGLARNTGEIENRGGNHFSVWEKA